MRVPAGTGALILLLVLTPARPVGASGESVATVSPGGVESPTAVVGTTPTFSWGSVRAASAFELVVYEVPERAEAEAGQPTLRVRLPGSASSWTPGDGSGLQAGRSYVWLMRALRGETTTEWSRGRMFTISAVPSVEEVEGALDVLRRYQEANDVGREAVEQTGEAGPAAPSEGAGAVRRARVVPQPLTSQTVGGQYANAAPDPDTEGRSLTLDSNLELGPAANIFKDGELLLWADSTNTAFGFRALESNTMTGNTAIGSLSQVSNVTGLRNTSVGWRALYGATGGENTAVGYRALHQIGDGRYNIAVGISAGQSIVSGDSNMMLGASGLSGDSNTIRIGNSFDHHRTFIAGDVVIGSHYNPNNQLLVIDNESASTVNGHVALIWNTASAAGGDVLALKVNRDNPTASSNFITFYESDDSILGSIEGDGAGSVTLSGFSGDFAEWLPLADPTSPVRPGDVVGFARGTLSLETEGAELTMVVSTAPIIAGNDPGEDRRSAFRRVAFLGQVPVRVRGRVTPGDLIVASGLSDGTAVAIPATELPLTHLGRIVGRAIEGSESSEITSIKTMVGIADAAVFGPLLLAREHELARFESRVAELERHASQLQTREQLVDDCPAFRSASEQDPTAPVRRLTLDPNFDKVATATRR